ncbi:MAG TPA: GGDEF domain-containing phosphodiesterase, partial [Burkholderiaceae bacterium]
IGITMYPNDATHIDTLQKHADQAMYESKRQGRNRSSYFTQSMQETAQDRRRLIADMRRALAERQFTLAYQPVVDLSTGAFNKAEALIRWQHPERGMVSPAEFIPVAEETGLIIEIGNWVFQEAVRQAAHLRATYHPDFQISVNVSPVQFQGGEGAFSGWMECLHRTGVPACAIVIEITEGLLLGTSGGVTDHLSALRSAGMRISLDDFGTGYSSLSYLKKFAIDYIKIDQSFIRNLETSPQDMALSEAIVVMARKLGLQVVAEGVETEQQLALLRATGCEFGQGYLFARPLPASELHALLDGAALTA